VDRTKASLEDLKRTIAEKTGMAEVSLDSLEDRLDTVKSELNKIEASLNKLERKKHDLQNDLSD